VSVEFEDPDDRKLATLARATRARTRAAEGACVRDQDGRTYAGATVLLESLRVSATGVALAMAVSSGATGLEAVAVVTEGQLVAEDLAAIREVGGDAVTVYRCGPDGSPVEVVTA
jgi:cytidine deaminase